MAQVESQGPSAQQPPLCQMGPNVWVPRHHLRVPIHSPTFQAEAIRPESPKVFWTCRRSLLGSQEGGSAPVTVERKVAGRRVLFLLLNADRARVCFSCTLESSCPQLFRWLWQRPMLRVLSLQPLLPYWVELSCRVPKERVLGRQPVRRGQKGRALESLRPRNRFDPPFFFCGFKGRLTISGGPQKRHAHLGS